MGQTSGYFINNGHHEVNDGDVPTIHYGNGAGVSAVVEVIGTDISGVINLTTGLDPLPHSEIISLEYFLEFSNTPTVVFSSNNINAAIAATNIYKGIGNTILFTLNSVDALLPNTEYSWNYISI